MRKRYIRIKDNTEYDDITRKCDNIQKQYLKYDSREDLVVKNRENMGDTFSVRLSATNITRRFLCQLGKEGEGTEAYSLWAQETPNFLSFDLITTFQ